MGHRPQSRNQEQKNRCVFCEGVNEAGNDCGVVVLKPLRFLIPKVVVGENCKQQDRCPFAVNELEIVAGATGCK